MSRSGFAVLGVGAAVVAAVAVVVLAEDPQSAVPLAATPSVTAPVPTPTTSASPTPSPSPSTATPSPATPTPVAATVLTNGSRDEMKVALTFDADLSEASLARVQDGRYPPQYNEPVIDFLDANDVPATIFVTGMWAQTYPEAMTRFAADPLFEVGNHSWDHLAWTDDCYGLPQVTGTAAKQAQVADTNEVIRSFTGEFPQYFRFPGLCHADADVEIAAAAGTYTVDTDLGTSDAFAKRADPVVSDVLAQVQPGSILLFHLNGAPNAPATSEIVEQLVPTLQEAGYTIVPLAELLGHTAGSPPAAGNTPGSATSPQSKPTSGYAESY